MNSLIKNLINGNLSDAKRQAKHFDGLAIRDALIDIGWSNDKAILAAHFLKGGDCYQAYCDAE